MKNIFFILTLFAAQLLQAQNIIVKETYSETNKPYIIWKTTQPIDTMDFKVFRSRIKEKKFKEIHTVHYVKTSKTNDSLYLNVIDTTLTKGGIYLYYAEVQRNGKKQISVAAMAHNLGVLPKPQIISFKAETLADRKAVRIHWKLNYTETVGSLVLYRSKNYDDAYEKIAELSSEDETYTDVVPLANEAWFYFLELNNYFGGKTRSVRTPAFATFKEKPFPPQDVVYEVKGDSIVFDWRNVGNNIIGYRVYRSIEKQPFMLLSDMQANLTKKTHFVDKDKTVKDAVKLCYIIRNVSDGFIESNITDTLQIYIPEHKPVYPPAQVDYVTLPDAKIKLLWMPDKRSFITGYNVYVKKENGKIKKLNEEVIRNNSYTDERTLSFGKYTYMIEGVGINNKASEKRSKITVNILPEKIEVLLDLQKTENGIKISWKKPANNKVKKLLLYRQTGNNKPIFLKSFSAVQNGKFKDYKLKRKNTYMYQMTAILYNGEKIKLDNAAEIRY